ncbi:MAG: patatin-like phospholipase family protein [Melioribacteraceae bacterium]
MSKLGLAFGGGGARGLAHIGVLKVLDAEGIEINSITGCSIGALVGGMYAYYGDAKKVEEFILGIIKDPKFLELEIDKFNSQTKKTDKTYFEQFYDYIGIRVKALKSLGSLSYFDEFVTKEIYEIIPDVPIENLKINFSSIATDLISGEEINFTKGSLREAIRASSAIPGIFPPVKLKDYLLVDGSASESVPVSKVREIGADRIVAVDVTRSLKVVEHPQNIFEILFRTEDITSFHLSVVRLKEADLVIRPQLKQLNWADYDHATEIITAGELAAKNNLNEIRKLISRNSYLLELDHFMKKMKRESFAEINFSN